MTTFRLLFFVTTLISHLTTYACDAINTPQQTAQSTEKAVQYYGGKRFTKSNTEKRNVRDREGFPAERVTAADRVIALRRRLHDAGIVAARVPSTDADASLLTAIMHNPLPASKDDASAPTYATHLGSQIPPEFAHELAAETPESIALMRTRLANNKYTDETEKMQALRKVLLADGFYPGNMGFMDGIFFYNPQDYENARLEHRAPSYVARIRLQAAAAFAYARNLFRE